MRATLAQHLNSHGRSVEAVAAWITDQLNSSWQLVWDSNQDRIIDAWENIGEPAYGIYNRMLFAPIQDSLESDGLTCRPQLPGTLKLSEEEWGPEDFRERRMWTLLYDTDQAGGRPVGALAVRFFHDHTELRLPRRPSMHGLPLTDHDQIRKVIMADPDGWADRARASAGS